MSLTSRMRTLLCCVVLEFGALAGVPMRPEEIRELMHTLAQPTLARTNPDRTDDGDDGGATMRPGWTLLPGPPGRSVGCTPPTRRWWRRWRIF